MTTTRSPSSRLTAAAVAISEQIGCPFVRRRQCPLHELTEDPARVGNTVVVGNHGIQLYIGDVVVGYHPNMARPRIRTLMRGGPDRLVGIGALRCGDSFLDCTCGLGADAAVASYVVGRRGRVCAIEQSRVLAALVNYGMQTYQHETRALQLALRCVEVVAANAGEVLQSQPDDAWDVVYFDPMFEETLTDSKGLDVVRMLAYRDAPTEEMIAEACRVARRYVLIKDHAQGRLLERLVVPVISESRKICYGRLEA